MNKIIVAILTILILLIGLGFAFLPVRSVDSDLDTEFTIPRSYQHVRLKLASSNVLQEILTSNNGVLVHQTKDKNHIKFEQGLQVNLKSTYCVDIMNPELGQQRLVYAQTTFSTKDATVVTSNLLNSSGAIKNHWIEIQIFGTDKEMTTVKIRSQLHICRRCPKSYVPYMVNKVNEGNWKNIQNMQTALAKVADQNLLNFNLGKNQIEIVPKEKQMPPAVSEHRRFPFLRK